MTKTNIVRTIVLILIFLFFILYFMQISGYSEYNQNKKNVLTTEEIEEYENDIKSGVDITTKDYLNKNKTNYENHISNIGLDLSYFIENTFNNTMNAFFKMLNEAVNE